MFINKPSIASSIVADNTSFPFEFKWYEDSDIRVYRVPDGQSANDADDQLDPSAYTITSNASKVGGTITINIQLTNGDRVTIMRVLSFTRFIDYTTRGEFTADTMDLDQDYQTYMTFDLLTYSQFFVRTPTSEGGGQTPPSFPSAGNNQQYIRWNLAGTGLVNDDLPPQWRVETEVLRDETAVILGDTIVVYNQTVDVYDDTVGVYNDTVGVHDDTILQYYNSVASALTSDSYGNQPVGEYVNVYASNGDGTYTATPQIGVYSSLHYQTLNTNMNIDGVSNVLPISDTQLGQATVSYNGASNGLTFGIPAGLTGEKGDTGLMLTLMGSATVAEINAMNPANIDTGDAWIMLDSGTITIGSQPLTVQTNDVVAWTEDGYFANIGTVSTGNDWSDVVNVTVRGAVPTDGDDLERSGLSVQKIGDVITGVMTAMYDTPSTILQNTNPSYLDTRFDLINYQGVYKIIAKLDDGTVVQTPIQIDHATGVVTFQSIPRTTVAPVGGNDLINKTYADTKVAKSGDTMTSTLSFSSTTPSIRQTRTDNGLYFYLQQFDDRFSIVNSWSGGEREVFSVANETGNANFSFAPTTAQSPTGEADLTRKDYVDSRVQQVTQAQYNALTPDPSVLYAIVG